MRHLPPLTALILTTITLTACSTPPHHHATSKATPKAPAAPTKANNPVIELAAIGDVLSLPKDSKIALNNTVTDWLTRFATTTPPATPPSGRDRYRGSQINRALDQINLVASTNVTITPSREYPDQLLASFTVIRPMTSSLAGLTSDQQTALLQRNIVPATITLNPVRDKIGRSILWLDVVSIELTPDITLTVDNLHTTPQTRKAYDTYYQGLKLQGQGQILPAIALYETALELDPHACMIANHYAFLLATSDDPKFHLPDQSLKLARQALTACQTHGQGFLPDILDTIARAYYETGDIANALKYEHQALAWYPRHRAYRDQLQMIQANQP